jgi:hypothetical protein
MTPNAPDAIAAFIAYVERLPTDRPREHAAYIDNTRGALAALRAAPAINPPPLDMQSADFVRAFEDQ